MVKVVQWTRWLVSRLGFRVEAREGEVGCMSCFDLRDVVSD